MAMRGRGKDGAKGKGKDKRKDSERSFRPLFKRRKFCRFTAEGIKEIVQTLLIAIVLVIIVVYIFLQGWRATLIPLLAVPVSLIGTFVLSGSTLTTTWTNFICAQGGGGGSQMDVKTFTKQ